MRTRTRIASAIILAVASTSFVLAGGPAAVERGLEDAFGGTVRARTATAGQTIVKQSDGSWAPGTPTASDTATSATALINSDARIYRTAVKKWTVDDNAGGAADLIVKGDVNVSGSAVATSTKLHNNPDAGLEVMQGDASGYNDVCAAGFASYEDMQSTGGKWKTHLGRQGAAPSSTYELDLASDATIKFGTTTDLNTASYDVKIRRSTTKALTIDDNASGAVTFNVTGTVAPTTLSTSAMFASFKTITSSDSPYTVLSTDYAIRANAASGAITINLPAVSSNRNRLLVIQASSVAGGNVTITRAGSDTINGATPSQTISVQYTSLTLHAPDSGVDWAIE